MTVRTSPFVPPAPPVPAKDLPVWRLLWNVTRSTLSIWPNEAFDTLYGRNRVMGIETLLVNDPEGVRHVLTANAANYRRPTSVTRVARPLVGSGLFLAEGADWRRQRRLLAPTFAPASIGLLLPHFREAGLHLLRSVETSPPRQSLESLSGHGSGGGPARPVLHAGERRPRDIEPYGARLYRRTGTADPRRRVFEERKLVRLPERQARALSETMVRGDRRNHRATEGVAGTGGPSRSPRSVVEPQGRRNRRGALGRRNPRPVRHHVFRRFRDDGATDVLGELSPGDGF